MSKHVLSFIYLTLGIFFEVASTTALKYTDEFTKIVPTILVLLGYVCALFFLTLTLRFITLGVAYAIWAGLGIVLVAIGGLVIYKQRLDTPAIIGIAFIIIGVVVINLLSKTVHH